VGVFGEEVFGAGMEVGEVAAASSGDEDFFAGFVGVVDEEDAAVAAACFDGAEESCGACSEDDYVELVVGGLVRAAGCVGHCWGSRSLAGLLSMPLLGIGLPLKVLTGVSKRD
jgi:hypothetical protein